MALSFGVQPDNTLYVAPAGWTIDEWRKYQQARTRELHRQAYEQNRAAGIARQTGRAPGAVPDITDPALLALQRAEMTRARQGTTRASTFGRGPLGGGL